MSQRQVTNSPQRRGAEPPSYPQSTFDRQLFKIEENWGLTAMGSDPKKQRIVFEFQTRSTRLGRFVGLQKQPAWRARMVIWTKNLPRLMRNGLHWSADNVVDGKGAVHLDRAYQECPSFFLQNCQQYELASDRSATPSWTATLRVFGRKASTATTFDLSWITPETVKRVTAFNLQEEPVYHANLKKPERNFNVVFSNDAVMEGWWPSPKGPDRKPIKPLSADEKARSGLDEKSSSQFPPFSLMYHSIH